MSQSRYIIGIDLGTTNCAVYYWDSLDPTQNPEQLPLPQWETPTATREDQALPSFVYLTTKAERRRAAFAITDMTSTQDSATVVGRLARDLCYEQPARVIHSSKSWLCHGGVDRYEKILPWHSEEVLGEARYSPVEVAAVLLAHVRDAFNSTIAQQQPEYRAELQDVVITVPASFDEVAQRLTLEAAGQAGFAPERIRLVEEPQAAFYHYLVEGEGTKDLTEVLPALADDAQTVLICDVGGGTTDFSLFEVQKPASPGDKPQVERVAVSDHLLLGGDNIDLALAHLLEARLTVDGTQLPQTALASLIAQARSLKEKALTTAVEDKEEHHVAIAKGGSSLFAGALTATMTAGELKDHILNGFFPHCDRDDGPEVVVTGLREWGLPYAKDTAITRHLAQFVAGRKIDAVLYTGGSLKPVFLQERLTELLTKWQGTSPIVLENTAMDFAVASGAGNYGKALRTRKGKIKSGYARSLYVDVTAAHDAEKTLLCLVDKGRVAHDKAEIQRDGLQVRLGTPVRFQLFSARSRPQDKPGALVSYQPGVFTPLPPLQTKLDVEGDHKKSQGQLVDVTLGADLQETGVMDLYCVTDQGRWQLNFNVRKQSQLHREPTGGDQPSQKEYSGKALQLVEQRLLAVFGKKKNAMDQNPKALVRDMEQDLGESRQQWDINLLRGLAPILVDGVNRRGRSPGHETSWAYLTGYCLRPGFGHDLDEWRIEEIWPAFVQGMQHAKDNQVAGQWWVMWRRVAGGLQKSRQEVIYDKLFPMVRKGNLPTHEILLLVGSLERVDMKKKIQLGNQIVGQLTSGKKDHLDQKFWALGRLASRVPLYGGPETVILPSFVEDWAANLAGAADNPRIAQGMKLFLSLAGRQIDDRALDVSPKGRAMFLDLLDKFGATAEQWRVVEETVEVTLADKGRLFGEELPSGLVFAGQ